MLLAGADGQEPDRHHDDSGASDDTRSGAAKALGGGREQRKQQERDDRSDETERDRAQAGQSPPTPSGSPIPTRLDPQPRIPQTTTPDRDRGPGR